MRKNYREALLYETIKELVKKKDDSAWNLFQEIGKRADVSKPISEIVPAILETLSLTLEVFTSVYNRFELKFEAYAKHINYTILSEDDELWPKGAEKGDNPVHFLYLCGNSELLSRPRLSVFGQVNPTEKGLDNAKRIVDEMHKTGYSLFCVLEKGIEQKILQESLKTHLPVIVVLASPLHQSNPEALRDIMVQVVNSGSLLLTGFSPCSSVEKWFSIPRNRLFIEISQNLAIPEERDGGPAWMLANLALEMQKPVFIFESSLQDSNNTYAFKFSRTKGVTVIRKKGELKSSLGIEKRRVRKKADNPDQLTLF